MSSRRTTHPPLSRLAIAAGLLFLGGTILWACGPFIPDWLLGDDASVLTTPTARFRAEIERLAPVSKQRPPVDETVEPPPPAAVTEDADRQELEAALAEARTEPARREALLAQLRQLREALQGSPVSSEGWTAAGKPVPKDSPVAAAQVPAGLPAEFDAYLRGAVAYHQGRLDEARSAWEKLLARPAGERRYRSTWAAFMVGKSYMKSDPKKAVQWFARTREVAAEKDMRDSLGLADSSLGWEARVELERGRFGRAIDLYSQQIESGDPGAVLSMRTACAKALAAPPASLAETARDDRARPFVTALVLSRTRSFYAEPEGAENEARKWLAAVETAKVKIQPAEAEGLAWTAYRAADFDAARRWLDSQKSMTPMAKWIRGKLLLRDGDAADIAKAETLLAEAAKGLPDPGIDVGEAFSLVFDVDDPVMTPLAASGDAGVAALQRNEYLTALQRFLDGAYWRDAAYVAERLVTVDELKRFVDEHWPADLVRKPDPDVWTENFPGVASKPKGETAYDVRYLLARRLIRAGRYDEARSYLPEDQHAALEKLAGGMRDGKDGQKPAAARSAALHRAACATRWAGLELLGTEGDPDWFEFGGQYELTPTFEDRKDRDFGERFGPTKDEVERAQRNAVKPDKRFHYRYLAADLGWQAAALLPDGSPEKAGLLAEAGGWLKGRAPEAAQRFYKELLRCCSDTDLGREAKRLRWLPAADACETEDP